MRSGTIRLWLCVGALAVGCTSDPSCPKGLVEHRGACIEALDAALGGAEAGDSGLGGDAQGHPGDDPGSLDGGADGTERDAGPKKTVCYPDEDGDGHGAKGNPVPCDTTGISLVTVGDDCNDDARTIHGAAPELCDTVDNDCDGDSDEEVKIRTFYEDKDDDGHGVPEKTVKDCKPPEGYALEPDDCRDDCKTCFPATAETLCDDLDNDCDGRSDEGLLNACGDCGPAPAEVCDPAGYDNDCDGKSDEGVRNACDGCNVLNDQPGANCTNGLLGACKRTGKYVCSGTTGTVCSGAPVVQGSNEICGDKVDNDCDGVVDDADTDSNADIWYCDADNDGYAGNVGITKRSCKEPAATSECRGWVTRKPDGATSRDCDDGNSAYHPGAASNGTRDATNHSVPGDLNCDGKVQAVASRIGVYIPFGRDPGIVFNRCSSTIKCECGRFADTVPTTCFTLTRKTYPVEFCQLVDGKAQWYDTIGWLPCK